MTNKVDRRQFIASGAAAAALPLFAIEAQAQAGYPNKPIQIVVRLSRRRADRHHRPHLWRVHVAAAGPAGGGGEQGRRRRHHRRGGGEARAAGRPHADVHDLDDDDRRTG